VPLFLLLVGCGPAPADAFLAYVRGADGYAITPRAIADLDDGRRMEGSLGTIDHGGRLVGSGEDAHYTGGVPLNVRYVVREGVAVPLDVDGLLLYSFYGNLEDTLDSLEGKVDTSPIFPVDFAWNPAVSPLLELSPVDNAAYAIGSNLFLLLPDGGHRDVPLLANAGVVAHEFGHAVFHLLQVGDPHVQPIVSDTTSEAGLWQSSLHEGFADSLAVLVLDDPHFLSVSIDMPARDVDGSAVLTDALLPANAVNDIASSVLPIYDPYPLGTVFASTFWDIRVATDDPEGTLDLLLRTPTTWAPETTADMDGFKYLDALVASADAEQLPAVCAAIATRFAGFYVAGGCP
jgi:hypothetical protein